MTIRTTVSEANKPYQIDPKRYVSGGIPFQTKTSITAKKTDGSDQLCDIAYLDAESFHRFLRSRGGRNDLAEDILKKMLNYPLQKPEQQP